MRNGYKESTMSRSLLDAEYAMNMVTYSDNSLSIKKNKRKTPKYSRMRMVLSSQTIETEKTRNQAKPQRVAIWKLGPKRKGGIKPTKGKKEERKRQNP
jgi:hypothetical protein